MTVAVVTGGRGFCETHDSGGRPIEGKTAEDARGERLALAFALDFINPSKVIEGGQHGADRWSRIWCERRGVPFETVEADWSIGAKAGPIRNQAMVDRRPDVGVRFPGGKGTSDCARRMEKAGVPVYEVVVH